MILESGPSSVPSKPAEHASRTNCPWKLIPISANSETSLRGQAKAVTKYLNNSPGSLNDVAYTLGCRRNHLSHRSFLVSGGALTDVPAFSQTIRFSSVVFAFSGQGTQWLGMGKTLMEHFDKFLNDIRDMDAALQRLPDPPSWSIESK